MWFFRKKKESTSSSKLDFLEGHPLHSTHALGKRHEEVVSVIHAPGRSAGILKPMRNTILDISALDPASCPTWPSPDLKIVSMLDLSLDTTFYKMPREKTVRTGTSTGMLVDNLPIIEKWVRAEESDNSILSTDTNTITAMDTQAIVTGYIPAGSSMEWHAPTAATFCRSPTYSSVSQQFSNLKRVYPQRKATLRSHVDWAPIPVSLEARRKFGQRLCGFNIDLAL
ncbi:hypothetical protein GQ600_10720 [Phytophthora cactorum]|nr:hypothetical protein GQ600_10720 [Phytophthora cactorum]